MQERNTDKINTNKNFPVKLQKIRELFNVRATLNHYKLFHKALIWQTLSPFHLANSNPSDLKLLKLCEEGIRRKREEI